MFAKLTLILCLFTGVAASATTEDEDCAKALQISPLLIQIAKNTALSRFTNNSAMTVRRYVDRAIVRDVTKDDGGTTIFYIDVLFSYSKLGDFKVAPQIVRLDVEGNVLPDADNALLRAIPDQPSGTIEAYLLATKTAIAHLKATHAHHIYGASAALRDLYFNGSIYRISLELTYTDTGITTAPQKTTIVVNVDVEAGTASIVETGGQGS